MKHYKVTLCTGLAWTQSYTVEASNETEALNMVADHIEETGMTGLYSDHYTLADEAESQTVEKYAEANNLVCCGNHGIYVQLLGIEEV